MSVIRDAPGPRRHVRVLAGSLTPGTGSHVYHAQLVRRLAERGHRVSVVCTGGGEAVRDCAEVVELPLRGYVQGRVTWRIAPWLEFRQLSARLRDADLEEPDVVIGGEHLLLPAHTRRFPRTPLIYLPHSLVVSHEIAGYRLPHSLDLVTRRLYRRLQRWALARADRTLRFTRTACDVLAAEYSLGQSHRFFVNTVGIDFPPDAAVPPPAPPLRLLYVGQLVARKRLDVVLRALTLCGGSAWRLDVVGDGAERNALEALSRDLGLAGRVVFHGLRPDPSLWYRDAHLLVLASRSESLGLVLLEAMAHGVPCLALRADGVTAWNVNEELIDHDRTGLLAHGDADLALQLRGVVENPQALAGLGAAARADVLRRFSWSGHLDRYEGLFSELIDAAVGAEA